MLHCTDCISSCFVGLNLFPGVGSRSQVTLELSAIASPAADTVSPPADGSDKSPGSPTAVTR